jgi:transcription antitermination factor NusG
MNDRGEVIHQKMSPDLENLSRPQEHFCKSPDATRCGSNGYTMPRQGANYNWYAVHTRHQHEKTVAQILESKGYEIFLPVYATRRKWQDRIKQLSLPLFPCYIFVREGLERWLQILTTPGVCSIVGCGGRPAAIPFSEIEGVRRIVEKTLRAEPHPFLKSGDIVKVKCGSLVGLEGILIRKKNITRLVLSVGILGQSAAVDVDASSVERIPTQSLRNIPELRPGSTSMHANRLPSMPAA